MEDFDLITAILATKCALLGEIRPNLRAVKIDYNNWKSEFNFWFYFDGEPSEEDFETVSCVTCEATAAYGPVIGGGNYVKRLDYPEKIPAEGFYVYLREESMLSHGSVNTDLSKEKGNVYLESTPFERAHLHVRLLNALLGKIRSQLRAVKTDINEWKKVLYFWFYFDKTLSDLDIDFAKNAIQEVGAYFGSNYSIKEEIVRLNYPEKIPQIGEYVYLRDEKSFETETEIKLESSAFTSPDIYNFLSQIQEELLGNVRPNLRAVKIAINEFRKKYYIWFYYDGDLSEEDIKVANVVSNHFITGWEGYSTDGCIDRLDYPNSIPHIGQFAYRRYETPV